MNDARETMAKASPAAAINKHEKKMTRLDWLLMVVTLVYAVVAFINLGSFDIPKTFYADGLTRDRGFESPQGLLHQVLHLAGRAVSRSHTRWTAKGTPTSCMSGDAGREWLRHFRGAATTVVYET